MGRGNIGVSSMHLAKDWSADGTSAPTEKVASTIQPAPTEKEAGVILPILAGRAARYNSTNSS